MLNLDIQLKQVVLKFFLNFWENHELDWMFFLHLLGQPEQLIHGLAM